MPEAADGVKVHSKRLALHPAVDDLACHVVKDHFGELCERVLRALLKRSASSFLELQSALCVQSKSSRVSDSGLNAAPILLTSKDVRSALLVLLQHSCVFARVPVTLGNERPKPPVYRVDLHSILFRLRHAACLELTAEKHRNKRIQKTSNIEDKEDLLPSHEEAIISLLLEYGRLRLEQVTTGVEKLLGEANAGAQQVEQAFAGLVAAHFVEQSPPCNLPDLPTPIHPNAQPRKTSKANQDEKERQDAQAIAARALKTAADTRFTIPGQKPAPTANGNVKAGMKRKLESVTSPLDSLSPESTGLWQLCKSQFLTDFRYAACAKFIGDRQEGRAEVVVQGLLRAASPPWTGDAGAEKTSRPVTPAQVLAAARQVPEAAGLSATDVSAALEQLKSSGDGYVLPCLEQGAFYVDLDRTVSAIQEDELEAHLQSRFGTHGLRIWRMLRQHGQLEENKIADCALMPPKEARTILYALLASGFVTVQDIPKGADRAASRMFWTWRANVPEGKAVLCQHLAKGVLNLRLRLAYESDQLKEVTALYLQRGKHGLTDSQHDALLSLKNKQTVCEARVLRLQPLLSLFFSF
ncbi:hypothetical protein WJX73_005213 [Symbiochloris irregularis]|uniref:DNA-directed RNA polymerase III subunit RPC3 n=1 Tax=Symbiochloris irregularis TaxID=706552 RepID=A0AAW1NPC0_9CHLO